MSLIEKYDFHVKFSSFQYTHTQIYSHLQNNVNVFIAVILGPVILGP